MIATARRGDGRRPPGCGTVGRRAATPRRAKGVRGFQPDHRPYGRSEEEVGPAYGPWREALGHLVETGPASLLRRHVERHGDELSRLTPAPAVRLDGVPPPQAAQEAASAARAVRLPGLERRAERARDARAILDGRPGARSARAEAT